MNKDTADLALQFMARTPLEGREVPAFSQVIDALMAIRDGRIECAPAPEDGSTGNEQEEGHD